MNGTEQQQRFQNALNEVLVGIYYPEQLASREDREAIHAAYRMAQEPFAPDPTRQAAQRVLLIARAHQSHAGRNRSAFLAWMKTPALRIALGAALMVLFTLGLSAIFQYIRPVPPSSHPIIAASVSATSSRPPSTSPTRSLPAVRVQQTQAPRPALVAPAPRPSVTAAPAPLLPTASPPSSSPQQLSRKFAQLSAALASMENRIDQANHDREVYLAFLNARHSHGNDIQALEASLANFDSYLQLAREGRAQARKAMLDRAGLDAQGQVTAPAAAQKSIDAMLKGCNQERFYLAAGIYELHSALNRYGQVWGTAVPNIPELDLAPFTFDPPASK